MEGQCQYTPHCWVAKNLWEHVLKCKLPTCQYPRCCASRVLLKHNQNCKDARCPVCGPVLSTMLKQRQRRLGAGTGPRAGAGTGAGGGAGTGAGSWAGPPGARAGSGARARAGAGAGAEAGAGAAAAPLAGTKRRCEGGDGAAGADDAAAAAEEEEVVIVRDLAAVEVWPADTARHGIWWHSTQEQKFTVLSRTL